MNVGAAQLEITPKPGLDLTGFAVRPQPSTAVLDPLFVRAAFFEDGSERLLWLHTDLLAFSTNSAEKLRRAIRDECGLPFERILLVTTHTHSGPAAISLTGCGEMDPAYVEWLEGRLRQAARLAMQDPEPCQLVVEEGHCDLGVNRRDSSAGYRDHRVGVLGWRRADGTYKAVLLCYAMHPVCLRSSQISGDWPGETARVLTEALPGRPIVLVSCGACGDINPPEVGVAPAQMRAWGQQVAEAVVSRLLSARAKAADGARLQVRLTSVDLPVEDASPESVKNYSARCLADAAGHWEFGRRFSQAVETWRRNMLGQMVSGSPGGARAELGAVSFGSARVMLVNAEIFSRFNELTCHGHPVPVYTAGCANGMIGYVAPREAYSEGGYEVVWSMLFYNVPRLREGGLELLAGHARRLLAEMDDAGAAVQPASQACDAEPTLSRSTGVASTSERSLKSTQICNVNRPAAHDAGGVVR